MEAEQLQRILCFSKSELWDAVMFIVDESIETETSAAISQDFDETKRNHQCGRAEAMKAFKELLQDTRTECLKRSGQILPENK
jgi:hypothetical protein